MPALGKCLAFCLKYDTEMQQLLWRPKESDERPDTEGLPDAERVLNLVRTVGDTATREALDFLEECVTRIEGHFRGLTSITVGKRRPRSKVEAEWMHYSTLALRSAPNRRCKAGVGLYPDLKSVVPWLRCRGGRRGKEAVDRTLGGRVNSPSGEGAVLKRGTLALGRILVPLEGSQGFEVDRTPLVEQVYQVFAAITDGEIEAILMSAAGGKGSQVGPDEADDDGPAADD
jgi:hypothetical protein